jgi:hypothetical protein
MKLNVAKRPNVRPSPCPHCGYLSDCASGIGTKNLPRPGLSVGLCIHCGAVNGYDEQLRLVALDAMELLRFELDPKSGPGLKVALRAWRLMVAQYGRPKRPLDGGIKP